MNAKPVVTKTKDRDLKGNDYERKGIPQIGVCKFLMPKLPKVFIDGNQAFIPGSSI